MDLYRRLRHTYGFGVHSPRAYRLVKDVLRPANGLRWYGYEDIEASLEQRADPAHASSCGYRSQHDLRSDSRLLLRLAAFLGVRSVWIPAGAPWPLLVALQAADSRMIVYNKEKDLEKARMIVGIGTRPEVSLLAGMLRRNPSAVILMLRSAPEEVAPLAESGAGGVMLRGRNRSIIMSSADGPLHLYDVL